jgi:hypothetical protein
MQINRTCILGLGLRCASGLRRLLHLLPGWLTCIRLAPAAAPSSSRPGSYPRFSSEVIPSSRADAHNPRLAPRIAFFGSASDSTSGLRRTRYLPATPLDPNPGLRRNPHPPVRLMRSFRLSPVAAFSAFAGGRLPAFAGSLILPVSPAD